MEADPGTGHAWIMIILIAALFLISALLTAAEMAVDQVNRNQIRQSAEEGDKRAETIVKLFERSNELVASAMVMEVFCALMSCLIFVRMMNGDLSSALASRGVPYSGAISDVILVVAIGCLFLVICVLYPRQSAQKEPEKTAAKLCAYARFMMTLTKPFAAIARLLTDACLVLTKKGRFETVEEYSEEEVMSILETGQEMGAIKEEGKKMIDQIFAFDDKLAYEIMTPRTDVFAIDLSDPTSEYIEELMELRYSRIPVYEDESDNIVGILNIKDWIIAARESGFENVDIRAILRKPFFVPETKNIDSLFFELQKTKQHIAILIDEYGGFSGIVTMEDIIEEIVGDIDDEYDEEEPDVEKISEDTFYLDGSMDLDDVNEETGSELFSEDSETVGGLIMEALGEIPEDGSGPYVITLDNYEFTVESIRDRRIERVRMKILPKTESEESGDEQ